MFAKLLAFLGVALLLLWIVPPSHGTSQKVDPRKPYALIFGTVWGPDNQPVYGAKVQIRPADRKKAKWELYSDHQGEFAQRVPAGQADYIVWVDTKDLKRVKSSSGKQLQSGQEVTVHIAGDERQDIGVHLK
jgi:hypothetical protein